MHTLSERDVAECVHPDENPRFLWSLFLMVLVLIGPVLAFIAAMLQPYLRNQDGAVALGITMIQTLLITCFIGLIVAIGWLIYRLLRGILRTRSALITRDSLPEMDSAIHRVCYMLSYPRSRIEAYLVSAHSSTAELFRGLRSNLLVIGSPVAEGMYSYNAPAELEFSVASHVGALRMRLRRTLFIAQVEVMAGMTPVLGFLVRPYLRATVYSADRLALRVTGNLQSAVDCIGIQMVGKDLTSLVAVGGWLRQHQMNRWSFISFLLRMARNEPHPIDRIANVLCFGRVMLPDQYEEMIGRMPSARRHELERILDGSRHAVHAAYGAGAHMPAVRAGGY